MSTASVSLSRPFIVSTGRKKTDPKTQKLIRTHVMLGRNRKKEQQEYRGKAKQAKTESVSNDGLTASAKYFDVSIPPRVGSDLATNPFPQVVDPEAAVEAIKILPTLSRATTMLASCIVYDEVSNPFVGLLAENAPLLQSFIMTSQAYFEIIGRRDVGYSSHMNFVKALRLLRERFAFSDMSVQTSDATIYSIINLAVYARVAGEDMSVRHHLGGVRKILDLRGGINTLKRTKILVDLFRNDIGLALHTGEKPLFCTGNPLSEPFISYPNELSSQCEIDIQLADLDDDLARAWRVMKNFCLLVKLAVEAQGRITWALYVDTLASIMYRLLHMRFEASSANEAIRLGLLVFCSDTFLQWKFLKLHYAHLAARYRECLEGIELSNSLSPQLKCWLLMIGALSALNYQDDPWLCSRLGANINLCGIATWSKMHDVMDSFMWISLVQEVSGREIFHYICASNHET